MTAWVQKIIAHFPKHGEDRFLVDAGNEFYKLGPYLCDVGYSGTDGKRAVAREMERQHEERLRKEPIE
jgi:hypothetical protein